MKSIQIMKREFNGSVISQRTSDKFFNATELLSIYNQNNEIQKRFADFWENQTTKNFINVLEKDLILNVDNLAHLKTHESTRGKGGATWMHPYLFVKFAMWLSPEFELAIIKWVYDNLIEVRHQAGDYYNEMKKAIFDNYTSLKGKTPDPYIFINEANMLNSICMVESGKRNELTEKELKLLSELQKINTTLINNHISKEKRKEYLINHANNFKIIYL